MNNYSKEFLFNKKHFWYIRLKINRNFNNVEFKGEIKDRKVRLIKKTIKDLIKMRKNIWGHTGGE